MPRTKILRGRIAPFVAAAAAALGVGAAVAVAAVTTSTATQCATTTAPTHTVGVDGSGVATVGGDTLSVCATATATDQTVTTTVPGPTTTVTTTVTTTAPPPQTYASAIAYSNTRPAFTPTRTVNVSSGATLKTAVSNLAVGDLVQAPTPFTYSTTTCSVLNINKALTGWAEIDLTGVTIKYTGTANCHGVDISAASHIRIFGGDITTSDTGSTCISDHGSNNVLWWGFTAHNCGGSGIAILSASDGGGAPDHLDFQGDIYNITSAVWDPHSEHPTGVHGAILWDGSVSLPFTNNRLAFNVHDTNAGSCAEIGQTPGSSTASVGNTMYLKCATNPCKASVQTCGNGLQLWGATTNLSLDVKYIQVDNYAGYPVYGGAISSGQNASGVTVEYGRATNDKTNAYPSWPYLWDNVDGIVYQDVQPAPAP